MNHGEHLLLIVLVAQTVAVALWNAADTFDWDLGRVLAGSRPATAAWWSVQAMLAAYFTSGLAKLVETRGCWIHRSPGLLLAARARVDTDQHMGPGRRRLADRSGPVVAWLFGRPGIARAVFAAGLVVESRRPPACSAQPRSCSSASRCSRLHFANARMLGLPFPEYQLLVVTFFVAPWWFR